MTRPLTGAEKATAAWWIALVTAGCAWTVFGWGLVSIGSQRLERMRWAGGDDD